MTKRNISALFIFVCTSSLAYGQSKPPQPSIQQKSEKSICTNIVALAGNVDINCSSLTPAQSRALANIPKIMKMALKNEDYLNIIMAKLDEMAAQSSTKTPTVITMGPNSPVTTGPNSPIVQNPNNDPNAVPVYYNFRGDLIRIGHGEGAGIVDSSIIGGNRTNDAYDKFIALQTAKDWQGLLKLSEEWEKTQPDWMTPFCFEGIALIHLGRRDDGIAKLRYVDSRTQNNSDFDEVRSLLVKIGATPR